MFNTKMPMRGSFRIRLEPDTRKEKRLFYAANSGGMFWTQMREVASALTEEAANNIARRIIARNARLRGRVNVVPA